MKIIIVGLNFFPEPIGIGKYTSEMVEWLSAHGHLVKVISAPPYYPQWRVAPGYSGWRYRSEQMNGVSVHRCPIWVPRNLRLRTRLLHLLSFALSSFPVILWHSVRYRPQVVLVIQPTLLCAPAAWFAARITGAKAWMHIQDFELDAAIGVGLLRNRALGVMVGGLERFLLKRFDRVSTISNQMLGRLSAKGVRQEKQGLFPNWVDTEAIFPLKHVSPLRQEFGFREDKSLALYSGNMGRKQGLEVVIEAARKLAADDRIQILLCGDGSTRERLTGMARGLPNVRFLPLQSLENLNDLLNMADIHLLIQRDDSLNFSMPSKLAGMLASGRPIIATALPGSQIASAIEGCGELVPPGSPESLAEAIIRLAVNPERRIVMGRVGRAYAVNHLDKMTILESFNRELAASRAAL